jgi:hypothetical protein
VALNFASAPFISVHHGRRTIQTFAGAGTAKILRDAPRLAARYGGAESDWAKVTSWAYKAEDGATIEIHAYENVKTGQIVELKGVSSSFAARR